VPGDAPELVRVLAADGTLAPSPAAEPYLEIIDALTDADLEGFYRDMFVIRAFDQQATNLQRQGQLALWPPSFGQEAAQVGSARAARAQDHLFPSYREHVVCTIRGVDPVDIIRVMRGLTHGGWDPFDPKNGNTHIYTLVLGSQTLHATGLAMGLVFDGKSGSGDADRDEAVIVYYGDGASSQGDVHEAMVFAASYRTPEVFFLQNNQWAISVPVATQSRSPLYHRGAGYAWVRTPRVTTQRSTAPPAKRNPGRAATRSHGWPRTCAGAERLTRSSPTSRPRARLWPTTRGCAPSSSALSPPTSCSTTSTASRIP
jgi:pyruvate dehydrogenase E1 component alpha subunit